MINRKLYPLDLQSLESFERSVRKFEKEEGLAPSPVTERQYTSVALIFDGLDGAPMVSRDGENGKAYTSRPSGPRQ